LAIIPFHNKLYEYQNIENTLHSGIDGNFADTIWTSPQYHGGVYECKIPSVVIIIEHRWFFGALITATLLELSVIERLGFPKFEKEISCGIIISFL
jgi:hypothetical protein